MGRKKKGPYKPILGQKVKRSTRNFKDPKYIAWRKAVFKSCGYACVVCGTKKKCQAHHLRPYSSSHPALRFLVSNGCILCKEHHEAIWGKEKIWAPRLMTLTLKRKLELKNGIKP